MLNLPLRFACLAKQWLTHQFPPHRLTSTRRRAGNTNWQSIERLELRELLAAGAIDTTFGQGGVVTSAIAGPAFLNDQSNSVTVQSDGKILVAGTSDRGGVDDIDESDLPYTRITLARYGSTGALDSGFGQSGIVKVDINSWPRSRGSEVLVQSDGKIVLAGAALFGLDLSSGTFGMFVTRYSASGALDTSFGNADFGNAGMSIKSIDGFQHTVGLAAALVPGSEKIVVVGYADPDPSLIALNDQEWAIMQFNANGQLDLNFGNQGIVTTDFAAGDDQALGVTIDANGKIIVVGKATVAGGVDFAVARYNSDGTLDTTFGADQNGKVTFHPTNDAIATSVALQSDGKITVAGYGDPTLSNLQNGDRNTVVARLTTSGALDTTFSGGTGYRSIAYSTGDDLANSVAVQSNDKIVLAGSATVNGAGADALVARLLADGSDDNSFGTTGQRTIRSAGNDQANAMVLQADGKVVVAGFRTIAAENTDYLVARIEGDAPPNVAPVLNPAGESYMIAAVGSRVEELQNGTLVSEILATGANGAPISDTNDPARQSLGIALTNLDRSRGSWEYRTTDADIWQAVEPSNTLVSDASALLLAADSQTRIRFVSSLVPHHDADPDTGLGIGTFLATGLTYRAWDQSTGANGSRANVSQHGGGTAYSDTEETVATYFEVRMFRSFNPYRNIRKEPAHFNVFTLQAEFEVLTDPNGMFRYFDRSGPSWPGFTVFLSPLASSIPTFPLYRLYLDRGQENGNPTTYLGFHYLSTSLSEVQGLESGPGYRREYGVVNQTAIQGYVLQNSIPGTNKLVQLYNVEQVTRRKTDSMLNPEDYSLEDQGDHLYSTADATQATLMAAANDGTAFVSERDDHIYQAASITQSGPVYRVEAARGYVHFLAPTEHSAQAVTAAATSEDSVTDLLSQVSGAVVLLEPVTIQLVNVTVAEKFVTASGKSAAAVAYANPEFELMSSGALPEIPLRDSLSRSDSMIRHLADEGTTISPLTLDEVWLEMATGFDGML